MADLNPLTFAVAIKDETAKDLEAIQRKLEGLKDHTIKIKVEGKEDIQAALNIDKLVEQIMAAKRALSGNKFEKFAEDMQKAAEAVDRLTRAFEQFNLTIGKDDGMRNFMTGLGEVIRNIRQTMGSINGNMNVPNPNAVLRSIKVAKNEGERLGNTLLNAQHTIDRFGDKGFDTTRLERYKSMLIDVRNNLDLIARNGGIHPITGMTASQYTSSEDVSRVVSLVKTELGLYKQVGNELERIAKLRSEINSLLSTPGINRYSRDDLSYVLAGLDLREGLLAKSGVKDAITSLKADAYKEQLTQAAGVISRVKAEISQSANDSKTIQTENEKWAASMNKAAIEATNLSLKIKELEAVKKRGVDAGVDVTALEQKIAQLKNMLTILHSMEAGMKLHGFAGDYIKSSPYQNTLKYANEEAAAVKKSAQEKEAAARAAQQLTAEQQRLVQALNQTTQAARGQSQVMSDLKMLATQYLGVWGAQGFLRNIIETGGQLEMQRLSIGAILQDTAQATTLFEQIKGLAVQSPFGVVQLDQMSKQLTAYGFQYHELYDWTKRLADISAATGTEVSRLALALGHVRSEAALSGYTLRQFSMGNVPLLQKLSEKLGKTTKEIRDMVKKKEISYEDVTGVLKDLTNEGGMFYNMQEVISQSVKAKFKNVRDAMDIMYGEMAEGTPGDVLKGIAEALMEVTKNWKDTATVIGAGAAAWGIARTATLAYNSVLGTANAQTISSIAAHRQKEAAILKQAASYRTLTVAEEEQIVASKMLTASERTRIALNIPLTTAQKKRILLSRKQQIMDYALAISEKKLTTEDIARQVALGRLSKAQARHIISLADLTAAERAAGLEAIKNTQRYGMLRMAFITAGNAAKSLAMSLKALVFNPATLFIAGFTAVMELWQRNSREMERAQEIADHIYEKSQEGLKNTRTMMESTGIRAKWRKTDKDEWADVTNNFGGQLGGKIQFENPKFDPTEAKQQIDTWTEYIRNYAATPHRLLNEAIFDEKGNVRELEDQFHRLNAAVNEVAMAYEHLQFMSDATNTAVRATDKEGIAAWFEDDVLTDIQDYDKALKNFRGDVGKVYADYRKNIDMGVKAARAQNKAFDEAASKMGTYAQAFEELIRNARKYGPAIEAFKDQAGVLASEEYDALAIDAFHLDNGKHGEMRNEMADFLNNYEAQLALMGHSREAIKNDKSLQQAIMLQTKSLLEEAKVSKEVYDEIMEMTAKHFEFELDINDEKFLQKKDEVTKMLDDLVEGDWTVPINFVENINNAIDEARKKYKMAKEFWEKTEPIRVKFGIQMKLGQVLSQGEMDKILGGIKDEGVKNALKELLLGLNQASTYFNKSQEASRNLGFSLEDPKDKKKGSKSKNKNKTGTHKTYKDPIAEEWKERIRLLKEANKMYEEWNKRSGRDVALARVQQNYGDIFEKWRTDKNIPWKDFKPEDIISYRDYVLKIADEAQKRYNQQRNNKAQNNGKEALAVLREAKQLLDEIDKYAFDEKSKEFASNVSRVLNDLSYRWDMFETIRDIMGDSDAAARMAAFVGEDFNWTATNKQRHKYNQSRAGSLQNYIDDFVFQNQLGSIDFDKVLSMTEDQIDKYVKDFINSGTPRYDNDTDETYQKRLELYQGKISGITDLLKEWQRLQKEVIKSGSSDMATLLADSQSVLTALGKIETEYENTLQTAETLHQQYMAEKEKNPNGNPHGLNDYQYQQVLAYAEAKKNVDLKELDPNVKQFYNSLISLNRRTAQAIGKELLAAYKEAFESGLFSADEYSEKVKRVLENMSKSNGQSNGSLFDRMSRFGGFLFSRRSDENREQAAISAESVRYRLEREKATKSSPDSDMLIAVLKRLEQALTNVAWGAGGRKEVATAGTLGRAMQNWGNMTSGQRALVLMRSMRSDGEGKKRSNFDQFTDDFEKSMNKVLDKMKDFQNALGFVTDFFDALGMEGASNMASDASTVLGGALSGASALSAFGPYGAAAGAALGLVSGIAQTHDAGLEREIGKLREDVQKIEANTKLIEQARERTLGFDTGDLRGSYAQMYKPDFPDINFGWLTYLFYKSKADKDMYDYYNQNSTGSGYLQEYQNLLQMRQDYLDILNKQESKKKKSDADIEETKAKIAELDDQIRFFTMDLAKELYDIDIKGWADQLSDALASAFENGESMAKAYKETVTSILQSLMSKMMQMAIIEPMFQKLQDKLFGKNGVFDPNDMVGSMSKVTATIAEYFGKGGEGEQTITAATEFMTAFQRGVQEAGLTVLNESGNTLSSKIQGTSEETSELLAAYVNALRQDVAVNRLLFTQFVAQLWPEYIEAFANHVRTVANIDINVQIMMEMLRDGRGAMYEEIHSLRLRVDNVVNGIESFSMK